ncbi:DUF4145 domain-containing protein [Pseudomonas putida]|uniref:DUF4145 domain-containing protein n=1 Tax=Pseudomonas putida TaxID=303 RepID=A0A6I6XVR8_PSEPU|nr:DUF4145 domain-containing protein [Pseudomonas putida]QHG64372.1 DUF4145 domain-containing protein [Pseudomonas putida]
MPKKAPILSFCNACSRETNHDIVHEKVRLVSETVDEGFDIEWSKTNRMIECRGCESISLQVTWWHSEIDLSDDIDLYPPRISRKPPSWLNDINRDLAGILRETYSALHADSRRLAMMGARTTVDMYMNLTVGDVGGFAKKLAKLVSDGHLSKFDKIILDAALEAGHAASHRGHTPSSQEINQVMDIVENMIQKLALTKSAEALSKGTPSRKIASEMLPES